MKRLLNCLILVALFAFSACANEADETDAIEAARGETMSWLSLTDAKKYAASWESAAALFQNAISRDDWVQSLNAVRSPIGALQSREVAAADFSTTLPGAPDGDYVVFQFSSSFENKASAVETVTAMKDSDGKWRVAGYFIK